MSQAKLNSNATPQTDLKSTNKKSNTKSETARSLRKREDIPSQSKIAQKHQGESRPQQPAESDDTLDYPKQEGKKSTGKASKKSELQFKQDQKQMEKVQSMKKNEQSEVILKSAAGSTIKEGHNNAQSNVREFSLTKQSQELAEAKEGKKMATQSKKNKIKSDTKQSKTEVKNEEKNSIVNLPLKKSIRRQQKEVEEQESKDKAAKENSSEDHPVKKSERVDLNENISEEDIILDDIKEKEIIALSPKRPRPIENEDKIKQEVNQHSEEIEKKDAKKSAHPEEKNDKKAGKSSKKAKEKSEKAEKPAKSAAKSGRKKVKKDNSGEDK